MGRFAALQQVASIKIDELDDEGSVRTVGWDPYEVWRTRVLLPRLQDSAPTPSPDPHGTKPYLLRST
jgi:hypothetical protein